MSGSHYGAIRSWWLDGTPGPLSHWHKGGVGALVLAEQDGRPLLVSGGYMDGAIRSRRLDGTPGSLNHRAHMGTLWAFVLAEHDGRPLLVSGGVDGAIRSWRLDGTSGPLNRRHSGPAQLQPSP